jgi:RNA polymerase sigma factor (TIGR02999 family)
MAVPPPHEITRLLAQANDGDGAALDRLLPLVYGELRALAHRQRLRQGGAETLNTTALVHEAYLKLAGRHDGAWESRLHFFRVAARVMRGVLVDYARAQRTAKRGGGAPAVSLSDVGDLPAVRVDEVLGLDEALGQLEALDAEQARLVELRYFTGLTLPEAAEALGLSERTAKRRWTTARAWLYHTLNAAA